MFLGFGDIYLVQLSVTPTDERTCVTDTCSIFLVRPAVGPRLAHQVVIARACGQQRTESLRRGRCPKIHVRERVSSEANLAASSPLVAVGVVSRSAMPVIMVGSFVTSCQPGVLDGELRRGRPHGEDRGSRTGRFSCWEYFSLGVQSAVLGAPEALGKVSTHSKL